MKRAIFTAMLSGLLAGTGLAQSAGPATRPAPAITRGGVGELKFESTPLVQALDELQAISNINMQVNWGALEQAGVDKNTPVTVRVRNVTLRKAIDLTLLSAAPDRRLTFYVDDGILEITTQREADQQMILRVYPVQDLLNQQETFDYVPSISLQQQNQSQGGRTYGQGGGGGGGQQQNVFNQDQGNNNVQQQNQDRQKRVQDLIDLITSTVRPEIWQQNGGTASIKYFNGNLIISAPRSVHEEIGGSSDSYGLQK